MVSVLDGLGREWGIHAEDVIDDIKLAKKIQYKAFDDASGYYENEIDHIYTVELSKMPEPNYEFAYGFFTIHKNNIEKLLDPRIQSLLAPWAHKIIVEKK